MKVDGQCHCGAIAYEADVDPTAVGICHCGDCQRLTGSAFRVNVPAPARSFRLTRGVPREYVKTADSGAKRIHAFCEVCGGPVYSCAIQDPTSYSLRVGALTQRQELGAPAREIWAARRFHWVSAVDGASQFERQPQGLGSS